MRQPTFQHTIQFQSEYRELIAQFTSNHNIDELTPRQIALFMDEVKYFWMERLDIIRVELESLTERNTCFLLSGPIYLNVAENEHFYFKSLGDFHLLHDPFLKIENFFRISESLIAKGEYVNYFRRVLIDSIKVLENYQLNFYILPIQLLAIQINQDHHEVLDKFFVNFLSSMFGKKYEEKDTFCTDFNTFEEIENQLEPYARDRIVFNRVGEETISLRRKIEMYITSQPGYTHVIAGLPEAKVFLIILHSYIVQISDILLTCSILGLYPYSRNEVTFSYLLLIMFTFMKDRMLRDMIEKTIIFYIFRKEMDCAFEHFESFEYYCQKIGEKKALPKILSNMRENDVDIFQSGVQKVTEIIQELFADIAAA